MKACSKCGRRASHWYWYAFGKTQGYCPVHGWVKVVEEEKGRPRLLKLGDRLRALHRKGRKFVGCTDFA